MADARIAGLIAGLAIMAACSDVGGGSSTSMTFSGRGSEITGWLSVAAGEYVVEGSAGDPAGCVASMTLVGTNEYPVVTVIGPGTFVVVGRRPNDPSPSPLKPDQVVGSRTTLAAGQYRLEVKAPPGCFWRASIHPPVPGSVPEAAVAARCSSLDRLGAVQFVKITGRRVPLPVNNPLAGDPQTVQPAGDTIEHYAIGIDDGSAVCTVLWTENQPKLGDTVSFTGEVLRRNGRSYLGVVLP